MKLTGKDGTLRIYDGSGILHGAAPLNGNTVDVVTFDGTITWVNITDNVNADDALAGVNILPDNAAMVFIGSTSQFALVRFVRGIGADYAVGSGALITRYWNGANFNAPLTGLIDGTLIGGDCFARDGDISFEIPRNWSLGANAYNANLDADKYYIMLMTTTSSSVDFDADVLCPADAQYIDVAFSQMDFNGPVGRPLVEEKLVLNRDRMNAYGHYVKGSDDALYQPLPLSFSCMIDSTYVRDYIEKALMCDNPNTGTWTGVGVTSKAATRNDGIHFNPAFIDTSKKAVNIQVLWAQDYPFGMAYYEVYFPPETLTIEEGEEDIILEATGGCYGVIEKIFGFGVRY